MCGFFDRLIFLNWKQEQLAGQKSEDTTKGKISMNRYPPESCIPYRERGSPSSPPNLRVRIRLKLIPPSIGTQKAAWLIVFLFIFDSLPQYPPLFDNGYWCKLSNLFASPPTLLSFCGKKVKNEGKLRKSSQFVKGWCVCRCSHTLMQWHSYIAKYP